MLEWSLLFVIVTEAISIEFRVALPWELLYADDLAVIEKDCGNEGSVSEYTTRRQRKWYG